MTGKTGKTEQEEIERIISKKEQEFERRLSKVRSTEDAAEMVKLYAEEIASPNLAPAAAMIASLPEGCSRTALRNLIDYITTDREFEESSDFSLRQDENSSIILKHDGKEIHFHRPQRRNS